jgi:nitrate reductase NapE component
MDEVDARLEWFKGDKPAVDLYETVRMIAHTWDDLVDRDQEVSPEAVNELMQLALVTLPLNPFFQKYSSTLYPVLVVAVVSYIASTKLERKGDDHSLELAHFLRYAIYMLPLMSMVLVGGLNHGVEMLEKSASVMIRERFEEFYKEHKGE